MSGVGHESDFTIADLASDRRAPTHSDAAEMAVPDQAELRASIATRRDRMARLAEDRLTRARQALAAQAQQLERASPQNRINSARQRVDELLSRAQTRLQHELALRQERLAGLRARLESLSPMATLDRGYALVRHQETGRLVSRVGQVHAGDELEVRVSDGEFEVMVECLYP